MREVALKRIEAINAPSSGTYTRRGLRGTHLKLY